MGRTTASARWKVGPCSPCARRAEHGAQKDYSRASRYQGVYLIRFWTCLQLFLFSIPSFWNGNVYLMLVSPVSRILPKKGKSWIISHGQHNRQIGLVLSGEVCQERGRGEKGRGGERKWAKTMVVKEIPRQSSSLQCNLKCGTSCRKITGHFVKMHWL